MDTVPSSSSHYHSILHTDVIVMCRNEDEFVFVATLNPARHIAGHNNLDFFFIIKGGFIFQGKLSAFIKLSLVSFYVAIQK
jgi:hypothetical protein